MLINHISLCSSFFSPHQYLAPYTKRNISTITNISKGVKLCYCSTALTDPHDIFHCYKTLKLLIRKKENSKE